MKHKFIPGRAYFVRFLDHTHGIDRLVNVEIIGWCLKETKDSVVFSSWRVNDEDKGLVENNHEPFTIVKSCIKMKRVIPKL